MDGMAELGAADVTGAVEAAAEAGRPEQAPTL